MGSDKKKKKKKEKVKYIDDGRTIADMSPLYGNRKNLGNTGGTMKDKAHTFFSAMRMMFVPMLIMMGIITAAYFIVWLMLK